MIYEFDTEEYQELPFMDWKLTNDIYTTEFLKNNRKYLATITPLSNSWKFKLVRIADEKIMIELRFRDMIADDALFKAETYIMEYAQ